MDFILRPRLSLYLYGKVVILLKHFESLPSMIHFSCMLKNRANLALNESSTYSLALVPTFPASFGTVRPLEMRPEELAPISRGFVELVA